MMKLKKSLLAEDEQGNEVFLVSNTQILEIFTNWDLPSKLYIKVHHPGLGDITEWLYVDEKRFDEAIGP